MKLPNQKGFTPLLLIIIIPVVILAIVILISGRCIFSGFCGSPTGLSNSNQPQNQVQQPSPTAPTTSDASTWKTYTNDQYHFSFSYPPDWILKSDPSGDVVLLNTGPNGIPDVIQFSINVSTKGYQNSFPNYTLNSSVGSIRSYRTANADAQSRQYPYIIEQFKKGDDYYQINLQYYNSRVVPTFNQVLTTFKFTQ